MTCEWSLLDVLVCIAHAACTKNKRHWIFPQWLVRKFLDTGRPNCIILGLVKLLVMEQVFHYIFNGSTKHWRKKNIWLQPGARKVEEVFLQFASGHCMCSFVTMSMMSKTSCRWCLHNASEMQYMKQVHGLKPAVHNIYMGASGKVTSKFVCYLKANLTLLDMFPL